MRHRHANAPRVLRALRRRDGVGGGGRALRRRRALQRHARVRRAARALPRQVVRRALVRGIHTHTSFMYIFLIQI